MTIFWMTIVRAALLKDRVETGTSDTDIADIKTKDFDRFLEAYPELTESKLFQQYYSNERLFSPEAKANWVEPDKKELPIAPIVVSMHVADEADDDASDKADVTKVKKAELVVTMKITEYAADCPASEATNTKPE
jgi:hypothetical protein